MRIPVLSLLIFTLLFILLPMHFARMVLGVACFRIFVLGPQGPIEGAFVTIGKKTGVFVTDGMGGIRVPSHLMGSEYAVAAEGYFITHGLLSNKTQNVFPRKLSGVDFSDYAWVHPLEGSQNCSECHQSIALEWKQSGHSRSSTSHRFLDMYSERKNNGNLIQGWSLSRDFPEGKAVCAACHAPGVGEGNDGIEDITKVTGVDKFGIHCDFCHKVNGVKNLEVGLSHGRDFLSLSRPDKGQVFFGPIKDAMRDDNSFSKIFNQSNYCASCHEGTMFGVHVYSTFSEWQKSPAAAKGMECQACHMKPDGLMGNVAPGKGGIDRNPMEMASHQMMPGGLQKMLQNSIQHETKVIKGTNDCTVGVQLKAVNVGHKIPTGYIDRHLILHVKAMSNEGELKPLDGDRIPSWVDQSMHGDAGVLLGRPLLHPDKQFTQPFWQWGGGVIVDSRLEPENEKKWSWRFSKKVEKVKVSLIYRPFWKEQQLTKKWNDLDVVVFEKIIRAD